MHAPRVNVLTPGFNMDINIDPRPHNPRRGVADGKRPLNILFIKSNTYTILAISSKGFRKDPVHSLQVKRGL